MVSSIVWQGFSWEAFATLATGLSAVLAAVYVARKQSEIQKAQVGLQSLALRSDLFDRRYGVYDRVQNFIGEIVRTADSPGRDIEQQFLIAKGEAKFLFDATVVSGLDEIWSKACEYRALKKMMAHTYQTEGHYGAANPQKECDANIWFGGRLQSLPDLFDTMKLGG